MFGRRSKQAEIDSKLAEILRTIRMQGEAHSAIMNQVGELHTKLRNGFEEVHKRISFKNSHK